MTTLTLPSLDERLEAFSRLCAGLELREQLRIAREAYERERKDPQVAESFGHIYPKLEETWAREGEKDAKYVLVDSKKALKEAIPVLSAATVMAVDTETTGLDPLRSKVRLLQLGTAEGTYVIDLFKLNDLEPLRPILLSPICIKLLHNAKFDAKMLWHHLQLEVRPVFDSLLASQLLHVGQPDVRHSLAAVCKRHLGIELDKTEQASNWEGNLTPQQLHYAAKDVEILHPLYHLLRSELEKKGLWDLFRLECELIYPMSRTELLGFRFNHEEWRSLVSGLEERQNALNQHLSKALSASQPQMGLFDLAPADSEEVRLDTPEKIKDATDNLGLPLDTHNEAGLQAVSAHHPLVPYMLEFRWIQKTLSNFGEGLWRYIHPVTDRIHGDFHPFRDDAGRILSQQPNLHLIPPPYRRCFIPSDEQQLIVGRLLDPELWIWGVLAGDDRLLAELEAGSLHQQLPFVYSVAYGRNADCIARQLTIEVASARQRLEQFADRFPKAWAWREAALAQGLQGHCRTRMGRIRPLGLDLPHPDLVSCSSVLQGSLSEVSKAVWIELDHRQLAVVFGGNGEWVAEGQADSVAAFQEAIQAGSRRILDLTIPADVTLSPTWH